MNKTVSEDDCKLILAKYFNKEPPTLTEFALEPISDEVSNGMSVCKRLKIKLQNFQEKELIFFVKTLAHPQEASAEYMKSANFFFKETASYKFFDSVKQQFPNFDTSFAPKCYFSNGDDFLVLEDLCENGYKLWDGPLEVDLMHVKLALESTAELHAASLIFEEAKCEELGREYRLIENYQQCLLESLYSKDDTFLGFKFIRSGVRALCALVDVFKSKTLTPEEFKEKLWSLTTQVFEDIEPSKKFRNVWCNGDIWTKNVMYKYENGLPVHCKIFDFQVTRYNPPAHDVVHLIYNLTDRKMRHKYFDYLLDHYYNYLKNKLKQFGLEIENVLTQEDLSLSVKEAFPFVIHAKASCKTLTAVSEETMKKLLQDIKLLAEMQFGDRSELAVKEFGKDEHYRDFMTTILEDLEDLLIHE